MFLNFKEQNMEIRHTNLKRDGGGVVPSFVPAADTAFAGWKPLAVAEGLVLAYKGTRIALNDPDESIDLGARILCGVRKDSDCFTVMTDDGPVEATVKSDVLSVRLLNGDFPPVVLKSVAGNPQSADVAYRELSESVSSRRLKVSEERQICDDFNAAYRRLCALAAGDGSAIQPAICRYRLVDSNDTVIFVSQPVILAPEGGTQFGGYHPLYSADGKSVAQYTLTAKTWKLGVSWNADPVAAQNVACMDIMMTPLFHPYDESLPSPLTYGRYASSSDVIMRVALPGRQRGLSSAFKGNARKIVRKAVASLEELETCVASVHNPFAESRDMVLDVSPSASPEPDVSKIVKALAKEVKRAGNVRALLNAPHRFTAAFGAAGAGVTMWSGIRWLPYKGCHAEAIAAGKLSARPWTAIVAVAFRDGSHVVRTSSGASGAFNAVAPLLCYPSADATDMVVQVVSDNVVRRGAFSLTPDASGLFSLYASPDLLPAELAVVANGQAFDQGVSRKSLPSVAAFTPTDLPTDVRLTANLPGRLTALCAMPGQGQSWEFGRERFVAATQTHILSVVTGAGLRACSVRTLCESGVGRSDSMCGDGRGGVFAVTHSAGSGDFGPLVHIGQNGHAGIVDDTHHYTAVARDGASDELWTLLANGTALVFEHCSTDFVSRRGLNAATSFVQAGDEAIAVCTDGIACLCQGNAREETPVEIVETAIPAKYNLVVVKSVRIDMQASYFDGEVLVEGLNVGDMRPWSIVTCRIKGTVAGPVGIPLVTRPLRAMRVTVTATVSSDFLFRKLSLDFL